MCSYVAGVHHKFRISLGKVQDSLEARVQNGVLLPEWPLVAGEAVHDSADAGRQRAECCHRGAVANLQYGRAERQRDEIGWWIEREILPCVSAGAETDADEVELFSGIRQKRKDQLNYSHLEKGVTPHANVSKLPKLMFVLKDMIL